MELTVKILQGAECRVEVSESMTIAMLKTLVESKLNVPKSTQKLVFRGKTLQDDDTVASSRLTAGSKVFLVTIKTAGGAPPRAAAAAPPKVAGAAAAAAAAAPKVAGAAPAAAEVDPWTPLLLLAERHLGKEDAPRFLLEFKKKFQFRLDCMSIDDIQRYCASDFIKF